MVAGRSPPSRWSWSRALGALRMVSSVSTRVLLGRYPDRSAPRGTRCDLGGGAGQAGPEALLRGRECRRDAVRRRAAGDVRRGQRPLDRGRGAQGRRDPPLLRKVPRGGVVRAVERRPERLVREPGEGRDPLGLRAAHEPADDVVGRPERDPAQDERVRERGRRRVALLGRRAHPVAVDDERLDEPGHHAQRRVEGRDRGEQRRLVLLEVALVRERQTLEQDEGRRHGADHGRGPSPHELRRDPGSSCWASSRSRWRTRRRRARTRSAGSTTR